MAQRGAWTPQKVRERIRTSMLVKRLENHVFGKEAMDKSQVAAALGLLKKTLPDLTAVDATVKGDAAHPLTISQTDAKL